MENSYFLRIYDDVDNNYIFLADIYTSQFLIVYQVLQQHPRGKQRAQETRAPEHKRNVRNLSI